MGEIKENINQYYEKYAKTSMTLWSSTLVLPLIIFHMILCISIVIHYLLVPAVSEATSTLL
jgi:hypothetical protein